MSNLSIIIPVYNEEGAIKKTIEEIKTVIEKIPNIEIIIVDDGSFDNTHQVLKTLNAPNIRTITHPTNKGYGAALKTGIRTASYENIAITDADSSYPNERLPELFQKYLNEKADMLVGARLGKIVTIGILRKFGKFLLRKLAEYLSEEKIPDLNSGMRIVKKKLVLETQRYLPNGFSFTSTLTLSLLATYHTIIYSPINYYKRTGKSKIRPIKDTLNFLQLIIRTVMFFNPLKIFLPLSGFFIILSIAVLLTSFLVGKVMDITTILLFITGLHFLATGLLADLIDKRLNK